MKRIISILSLVLLVGCATSPINQTKTATDNQGNKYTLVRPQTQVSSNCFNIELWAKEGDTNHVYTPSLNDPKTFLSMPK